jgi:hypothetical protein
MQWRILVADGSQDASTVVDAVLRRNGRFEIYHARNGEDAWRSLDPICPTS